MKKRDFLKAGALLTVGAMVAPLVGCNNNPPPANEEPQEDPKTPITYELPALSYGFDALEPHIDAQTMEIHHDKHHAGYTKKLNKALEGTDRASEDLMTIFANLQDKEEDTAVRNNGGGFYNHKLFWEVIGPNKGGQPTGDLATAIDQSFGSFENFSTAFKDAASSRFGSGWAWLIKGEDGKLAITDTPNQDNPLMKKIAEKTGTPILGLDVWEHAYYLKYQNKRGEYINSFFNIINWDAVGQKLAAI